MPLRTWETIVCWLHYRAWIIPSPLSLLQTKPSSFSLSLQVGHVCTALVCPPQGWVASGTAAPSWWLLLEDDDVSFRGGQQGHHQPVPTQVWWDPNHPTALGMDEQPEAPRAAPMVSVWVRSCELNQDQPMAEAGCKRTRKIVSFLIF